MGTSRSPGPSTAVVCTTTSAPARTRYLFKACTLSMGPPYRYAGRYVGVTCRMRIHLLDTTATAGSSARGVPRQNTYQEQKDEKLCAACNEGGEARFQALHDVQPHDPVRCDGRRR